MSAIILESSLVHYEALGRGKPLLFLHDWLGSWRYWVPSMVELSSSYRAYALDFWGFGDSDKVPARYSLKGYVEQVALFMDQMGIGKIPMVGHGLGGMVACLFAAQYPERVDLLMAVCTPLVGSQIARPLSTFSGGDNPASRILGRKLSSYQEVALEAGKTDAGAVVSSVKMALEEDLTEALENLDLPVMMLYGGQDPIIQPPDRSTLDSLDYNVYPFLLEEAQHYPMLEDTNKFNRLLRDFMIHRDNWEAIQVKEEWRRRMR